MVMKRLEAELRRGGKEDQAYADIISNVLKARGKDVPLPKEATPVEVRRFSQEAKGALEKEGYKIHTLTGQSIASLHEAGRKFWTTWHKDNPQFEALTSMQSEVAVNPSQLFLPKSNNKTLTQQEEMISKFSQKLGKKIPGVEAIMGGVPDYVDLAFTHLDATGERLFHGENYDYDYARSNTPTAAGQVARVGYFNSVDGLHVSDWRSDRGHARVFAAPLVVPKA
jgi:hypothetical protein